MISKYLNEWIMILDRSLVDRALLNEIKYHSHLITLERLLDGQYFQNNRKFITNSWGPYDDLLNRFICSMTKLEKLTFVDWELTPDPPHSFWELREEDFARVFQSCHKLTELRTLLFHSHVFDQKLEMGEELENEFRSGFQRLRFFELVLAISSWPTILKIFT